MGSPQDPYLLGCWPHSPNGLPALMHPSDSTCRCIHPNSFFAWHPSPLWAHILCFRRAAINQNTPCSLPQKEIITEEGVPSATRQRDSVFFYRVYRNKTVWFTSQGLILGAATATSKAIVFTNNLHLGRGCLRHEPRGQLTNAKSSF